MTGELDLSGEAKSDKIVGYFAYIETVNGFRKPLYWTKEKVLEHAKRYSKSFSSKNSAWQSNFDEMALKTMLRNLLSKYGVMSVEMVNAFTTDATDERTPEAQAQDEVDENANQDIIDVEVTVKGDSGEADPWANSEPAEDVVAASGPGF